MEEIQQEVEIVTELIRQCVDENSRVGLDQLEYQQRYNGLVKRYEKAKSRLERIEELHQDRRAKREQLDVFLDMVLTQDSAFPQ